MEEIINYRIRKDAGKLYFYFKCAGNTDYTKTGLLFEAVALFPERLPNEVSSGKQAFNSSEFEITWGGAKRTPQRFRFHFYDTIIGIELFRFEVPVNFDVLVNPF